MKCHGHGSILFYIWETTPSTALSHSGIIPLEVPRMESSILCLLEAHLGTTCRYFSPSSHRFLLTRHRFQNLFSTIWFRCVPTVMMPLAHRLDGEPGAPNVPFKTCMPSAASASRHITSHHLYWELCIIWYKRRMYFTLICWCLYTYKYIHFMFTWKKTVLSKTHGSLISFLKMHFGRFFGRSTYRYRSYHGSASRRHFLPQTTNSGSSWMTDVTDVTIPRGPVLCGPPSLLRRFKRACWTVEYPLIMNIS